MVTNFQSGIGMCMVSSIAITVAGRGRALHIDAARAPLIAAGEFGLGDGDLARPLAGLGLGVGSRRPGVPTGELEHPAGLLDLGPLLGVGEGAAPVGHARLLFRISDSSRRSSL